MWWAAAQAHININTYKSRPTGTESSAIDTHTHTHTQESISAHMQIQTHSLKCTSALLADTHIHKNKWKAHYGCNAVALADGPIPKVSLKHLPAGNLHRVPLVHTVWGKHTLCKSFFFFFWNETHTTRNSVLMAIMSAKANGCYVCLLMFSACVCFLLPGRPHCAFVTSTSFITAWINHNEHKDEKTLRWSDDEAVTAVCQWLGYTMSPLSLNQQHTDPICIHLYWLMLPTLGIKSIYKQSQQMVRAGSAFGVNWRICLILKGWDDTFSVFG